jgi:hypothetical protein
MAKCTSVRTYISCQHDQNQESGPYAIGSNCSILAADEAGHDCSSGGHNQTNLRQGGGCMRDTFLTRITPANLLGRIRIQNAPKQVDIHKVTLLYHEEELVKH